MAKLTCRGGVGSVTGANFELDIAGKKVLIDCGLTQGSREADEQNRREFKYDPSSIDILFVTHSHIDHIGLIPKLVKSGFKGEIWSTPETEDIAKLMLADGAKINERNARYENVEPLYTAHDVHNSFSKWNTLPYHESKDFGGFSVKFLDAGHILGSSMVEFTVGENKMLFTGDIGNSPSFLLKDTEHPRGIKYMVMESVYGDRLHEDRDIREERFRQVVMESMDRGGTLLIPAFSLERTQVILHLLDDLVEEKKMKPVPVFLDSPLAIKVTDVYSRITEHYNAHIQKEVGEGDDVFSFPRFKETGDYRLSREIGRVKGPKIIIAGSGMSTAGRIVGHEEHYLPHEQNTILFMGYQAPGTLGRQISEGMKKVVIGDKNVSVKARVESITGFSAHADSDMLVNLVSHTKDSLEKVFVAMGEPKASTYLAQRLRDELGVNAIMPEKGKGYELEL